MTTPHRFLVLAISVGALATIQAHAAGSDGTAALEKVTVKATAHFDFDRTTVLPADQQRLLSEVATLKDVTWRTVSATGHADSIGRPDYNMRLSTRRAESVRAYLVGKGLDPAMIHTDGAGVADPVASNDTTEGRAQNRRAEVVFEGVRSGTTSAH